MKIVKKPKNCRKKKGCSKDQSSWETMVWKDYKKAA